MALSKGKPVKCSEIPCAECDLNDDYFCITDCREKILKWANSEYKEEE